MSFFGNNSSTAVSSSSSGNIDKNDNSLSREKFLEVSKSIEKIGSDWFLELDKYQKDLEEVQRLSRKYPNTVGSFDAILTELNDKKKQVMQRISTLHTMLWNIRHQAHSCYN